MPTVSTFVAEPNQDPRLLTRMHDLPHLFNASQTQVWPRKFTGGSNKKRVCPKEVKTGTHTKTCTQTFTAALCAKAERWKQPTCPSTNGQINKPWWILVTGCYSAIRRNQVLTHATWMNLENITLSERRQTQKSTHCVIPFARNGQSRQAHRDR